MTGMPVLVGIAALSLPVPGSLPVSLERLASVHLATLTNKSAGGLLHAAGPCTPVITHVSTFTPGQYPNVTIQGRCFGTRGDSYDLRVTDLGPNGTPSELDRATTGTHTWWRACSSWVSCTVSNWTSTSITLASFGGSYGPASGVR